MDRNEGSLQYLGHLTRLLRLVREKSFLAPNLDNYLEFNSLLHFKEEYGFSSKLQIDEVSCLPSYGTLLDIASDKSNIHLHTGMTHSPGEARERLISRLETSSGDDVRGMDMPRELGSIAYQKYLQLLESKPLKQRETETEVAEKMQNSELVLLTSTGFTSYFPLPCTTYAEVTLTKKKGPWKTSYDSLGKTFDSLFGQESSVIFCSLDQMANVEARRVWRSYAGPFYYPGMQERENNLQLDPAMEILTDNCEYPVLSVHLDRSDVRYNKGVRSDEPSLRIQHHYAVHEDGREWLQQLIPDKAIISGVYNVKVQ